MDALRLEASEPRDIHLSVRHTPAWAKNLCDVHSNFSSVNQIILPSERRMRRGCSVMEKINAGKIETVCPRIDRLRKIESEQLCNCYPGQLADL